MKWKLAAVANMPTHQAALPCNSPSVHAPGHAEPVAGVALATAAAVAVVVGANVVVSVAAGVDVTVTTSGSEVLTLAKETAAVVAD